MGDLMQPAVELARSLQSWQYSDRLQVTAAISVVCSVYLSVVVRRIAPSYTSLLAVVPVVAVNALVPLTYPREEVLSRICWSLLLLWLGSFKAIGLCLGRGPLVGSWNIAQTAMLYTFPIYPCQDNGAKKGRLGDSHGTTVEAIWSFVGNTTLLCVLGYVLSHELPKVLTHYLYGIALYAFITFLMDGPAALLIAVLGMRVVPPFDKPWLSTSVGDYWGRRWNNTTGLTLRALVYDPIVEGSLMARTAAAAPKISKKASQKSPNKPSQVSRRPPMWLKLFGMCATFAVSGVMHEVLLYLLAPEGQYHMGYWFTFFFIQAPIMFAEGLVLRMLHNRKIYIPRVLAIPLTTTTVLATAWYFWYPPLELHTNLANEAVTSINANVGALAAWGQGVVEHWDLKQGLELPLDSLRQTLLGIRAYMAESATSV